MKKFRNNLQVYGSDSLLEAFEKELIKLGYNHGEDTGKECITAYQHGQFCRRSNRDWCHTTINLPQGWEKGLKLAAEVEEEEITEYNGWKVGETIEIADIIKAFPNKVQMGSPKIVATRNATHGTPRTRQILSFVKTHEVYMVVSGCHEAGAIVADTLPSKEEWEQKKRIDKEVKESGLKIGDKELFEGKRYYSVQGSFWSDSFYDAGHEIVDFEIFDNTVCAKVKLNSLYYYFKVSDLKKPEIVVAGHKMEIRKSGVWFGCTEITKNDIFTLHKLVGVTDVTIGGTKVTKELLSQVSEHIK